MNRTSNSLNQANMLSGTFSSAPMQQSGRRARQFLKTLQSILVSESSGGAKFLVIAPSSGPRLSQRSLVFCSLLLSSSPLTEQAIAQNTQTILTRNTLNANYMSFVNK